MSSALVIVGDAWVAMKEQSALLVKSGFLPNSVKTAEQALAIMMMGHELGVGPMESFAKISVIQGKPTVGAELMKAMVHKKLPGAKFDIVKSDKTECIIEASRPGGKVTPISFTMEDAASMKLVGKDNWQKMPKVMLRWRAISEACRAVFPDCLSGISYTPEELNPDLKLNEQGDVIETTASPSSPTAPAVKLTQQLKTTPTPQPAPVPKTETVIEAEFSSENIPPQTEMDTCDDIPPEHRDTSAGEYIMPFGKDIKGKKLSEIGIPRLLSMAVWLENDAKKKGEPLSFKAVEFMRYFKAYSTEKHVSQVE